MPDEITPTPQGEQQPIREVEVGEWFNPFGGYDNLPLATNSATGHSKRVPFEVMGAGRFEASAYYRIDQFEFGIPSLQPGKPRRPVIVILPDKDQVMTPEDLRKLEIPTAKLSIRALEQKYHFNFDASQGEMPPYKVEVRSPHGNTYTASFDSFFNDFEGGGDMDADAFGENRSPIATPDSGFVLEKIEMRIVPEAGEQR